MFDDNVWWYIIKRWYISVPEQKLKNDGNTQQNIIPRNEYTKINKIIFITIVYILKTWYMVFIKDCVLIS